MYRTLVNRFVVFRIYPIAKSHVRAPKSEEMLGKSTQGTKSVDTNDEVKFDYINKTGIISLNKPKALNALSLSMIRQIYPKMKVRIHSSFDLNQWKIIRRNGNPTVKQNWLLSKVLTRRHFVLVAILKVRTIIINLKLVEFLYSTCA